MGKEVPKIMVNNDFELELKVTHDYNMFHLMNDNRSVEPWRKNKILKSAMKIGWQPAPMLVNSDYMIIDGQGRWTVAMEHGLPLVYFVANGIGIEECRAMNVSQSPWRDEQYVDSFAADGNVNYQRIQELELQFGWAKLTNVVMATTGKTNASGVIRDGTLEISEENLNEGTRLMRIAGSTYDCVIGYGDDVSCGFFNAVMFASQVEGCNHELLVETCGKYSDRIDCYKKTIDMLRETSEYYNRSARRYHTGEMDFNVEYRKAYNKPGSWYSKKWGHYVTPDDDQMEFDFGEEL